MSTKIQFQKNATVLAADGLQVGSLNRVVVNPDTREVTDIVVRVGTMFTQDEKVIPVDLVAEATEDQIRLSSAAGDQDAFPSFEEKNLIDANEYADETPTSANSPSAPFGYPELGLSVARPAPGKKLITQVKQNIPEGTVAMKEGAKVITLEGKYVGNVESVLADPAADKITHLLISKGLLSKETKLIPIQWVMTMGREKVILKVKKASVEELTNTAVAE